MVAYASRSAIPKEPWWEKGNPENMVGVTSVQQFVDELVSQQQSSLPSCLWDSLRVDLSQVALTLSNANHAAGYSRR